MQGHIAYILIKRKCIKNNKRIATTENFYTKNKERAFLPTQTFIVLLSVPYRILFPIPLGGVA